MRCHTTMRAVFAQHREVAKQFLTGLPYTFTIMVRPGHSVEYQRVPVLNLHGDETGKYQYVTTEVGWKSGFDADECRKQIVALLKKGMYPQLFSLCEKGNPYALR